MSNSVVLCPRVVEICSDSSARDYKYKILARLLILEKPVKLAVDSNSKLQELYTAQISKSHVWGDILQTMQDREHLYFYSVPISKRIRNTKSVVRAVARNKKGGNEVIAWEASDYQDDDIRVLDRDEAVLFLKRNSLMEEGVIYNVTMGDNSVFNTGEIQNSFNKLGDDQKEVKEMLRILSEEVFKSKNEDAGEFLTAISTEINSGSPKKALLSVYWEKITEILPHVKNIVGITTGITKLLT
ncbi:hypothetical protein E1180_16725 [Roseibium denhamense]|nr:hypothetical protein [Roseibium denhamense]MTI07155.1 hypothetical protein [Roseibium denhamense]